MIKHEPVLLEEVIASLHIKNQGRYIDATLGTGGYTKVICDKGGQVLALDTDESMIKLAQKNLQRLPVKIIHANFKNLKKVAEENDFTQVDGIVFDLGVSNVHFMNQTRGFSFRNPDADLDMRLDPKTQNVKASDLLNLLREDQLTKILGKSLAKKVVEARKTKKFSEVRDFLSLFGSEHFQKKKIHPATVPFMMLRIAVNSELENLEEALPQAYELLKSKGILAVVSFHSLEDEIVKNFFRQKGAKNEFVRPSAEEVNKNPKSRSAILRVLEKV
jgi:16S rRNA (cytosine1402-N4)-methyltransferase